MDQVEWLQNTQVELLAEDREQNNICFCLSGSCVVCSVFCVLYAMRKKNEERKRRKKCKMMTAVV